MSKAKIPLTRRSVGKAGTSSGQFDDASKTPIITQSGVQCRYDYDDDTCNKSDAQFGGRKEVLPVVQADGDNFDISHEGREHFATRKGDFPNSSALQPPDVLDSATSVTDSVINTTTSSVSQSYTYCELFMTLFSMCTYIFDVGSDIYIAVIYYHEGDWAWFALTVSFIVVPSLTITAFSFAWYLQDRQDISSKQMAALKSETTSRKFWIPRLVLVLFQLGPIIKFGIVFLICLMLIFIFEVKHFAVQCILYVDTMVFGCKSKKAEQDRKHHHKEHWYRLKTWEETDSALLRLIECFMEAAPQLTLQLYIIAEQGVKEHVLLGVGQVISCVTSLGSIAWAITAYQKALRLSLSDKENLSYGPMAVMFCWRVFTIGARVVAIALFTSCAQFAVAVVLGIHWVVMFFWILIQRTTFCRTRVEEVFFDIVAAFINIFDFFNLIEGHTRLRYIIYYSLVYCENLGMILYYYCVKSTSGSWTVIAAMVVVIGLFFVGIGLQLFYYLCCHPNNAIPTRRIRFCVSCKELTARYQSERSKSVPVTV